MTSRFGHLKLILSAETERLPMLALRGMYSSFFLVFTRSSRSPLFQHCFLLPITPLKPNTPLFFVPGFARELKFVFHNLCSPMFIRSSRCTLFSMLLSIQFLPLLC